MSRAAGFLAMLLLLACGPRPVPRAELLRRAVGPARQSGWARLPLDGAAQRAMPGLWLGDSDGVPVPFEVERDSLWQPRRLDLGRLLLGRDRAGRPGAEFSLRMPEGWRVREREHLTLDLDLQGRPPWVVRVAVERRLEGGAWLRLETTAPVHLYDLGGTGRCVRFSIPWDGQDYRLALDAAQGAAPRIAGVAVTAETLPDAIERSEPLVPGARRGERDGAEVWTLDWRAPERIVAAEVLLKPPAAPVQPSFRVPAAGPDRPERPVEARGLVWNLPALATRSSWIALAPVLTDRLECALPAGARVAGIRLRVRRETLVFPAEAGRLYYLHTGGGTRRAPGSLAALEESSRAVHAREPLVPGPAEPDPQGVPAEAPEGGPRLPWLPWVAGALVLLLAAAGWRLLRQEG